LRVGKPKLEKRLPKHALAVVLNAVDLADPLGARDRAIPETLTDAATAGS
jgi:site-specific recombinase XerC